GHHIQLTNFLPCSLSTNFAAWKFIFIKGILVIPKAILHAKINTYNLIYLRTKSTADILPAAIKTVGGTRVIGISYPRGKLFIYLIFKAAAEVDDITKGRSDIVVKIGFKITDPFFIIFSIGVKHAFSHS